MVLFSEDKSVHQALFKRFDYLQDFPLNIEGKFIEKAMSLGIMETDDFLGFLIGQPTEADSAGSDRFQFLSAEENQKISHYQLINPAIAWPQAIVGISQEMRVTGTHKIDVVMRDCGSIQLWWGRDIGVLWECILNGSIQQRQDFEVVMNQVWRAAESVLRSHGVTKIVTYDRDSEYDLSWYQAFLKRQGYEKIEGKGVAVAKYF